MPQDAINLYKLGCELSETLVGGKINRITMPEKDEIHLQVYAKSGNHKLIISASASSPRCHLTCVTKDNPVSPPSYCMLLRKYLQNGQIDSIFCDKGERILHIVVSNKNELSDDIKYHLIVELMARQSNMFLTLSDGKILGALKQYALDDSKRSTIAGMKYVFPMQDKLNPYCREDVATCLEEFCGGDFADYVNSRFMGFAFSTVCELAFCCFGEGYRNVSGGFDKTDVLKKFSEFLNGEINAVVYLDANKNIKDFSFCKYITSDLVALEFASLNSALDYFYTTRDSAQRINEKTKSLKNIIKNAISRYQKKLNSQNKQIKDCEDMEKNRIYGELITSYLYKINSHDDFALVENYYEDMKVEKIPLQKSMSPSKNAQNYFKRYSKQKRTFERVSADIEETENFIFTLKTILASLERTVELKDVELVKDDLLALKIISPAVVKMKKNRNNKKNYSAVAKKKEITPLKYNIGGVDVFLGRNSLQNEHISFKIAKSEDVWFHINKYFGSHLVAKVKLEDIPDETLITCAEIVAYHSDARSSEKAVVDYTLAKNLKKPPRGNLGLVIYNTNYSIVVQPKEHKELLV